MMEIWIATGNSGKLKEFESLLKGKFDKVHSQRELDYYAPPEETGATFKENAEIKARSLKALKPQSWVIGEDSGLEVDGLNGIPGVHSARYAGPKATSAENTAKLLKMLQLRSPKNRTAAFRCFMIAISPDGKEYLFEGSLKGEISLAQKGKGGFGYDDVFIPEGRSQTLAEIDFAEKNRLSHRGQATKRFLEFLSN